MPCRAREARPAYDLLWGTQTSPAAAQNAMCGRNSEQTALQTDEKRSILVVQKRTRSFLVGLWGRRKEQNGRMTRMLLALAAMIDDEQEKVLFETLYRTYKDYMYSLACKILQEYRSEAYDVVQEVFIAVAKNIKTVRSLSVPMQKSYLLTSVQHRSYNVLKTKKREHNIISLEDEAVDELPDDADLAEIFCAQESYETLCRVLRSLPELDFDILSMLYFDGMKRTEIARSLDIPYDTLKKRIARAVKRLKEAIAHEKTTEISV